MEIIKQNKTTESYFQGFGELFGALEAEPGKEQYKSPEQFKERARNWAKFCRIVHFDEDVTPYIHGI